MKISNDKALASISNLFYRSRDNGAWHHYLLTYKTTNQL